MPTISHTKGCHCWSQHLSTARAIPLDQLVFQTAHIDCMWFKCWLKYILCHTRWLPGAGWTGMCNHAIINQWYCGLRCIIKIEECMSCYPGHIPSMNVHMSNVTFVNVDVTHIMCDPVASTLEGLSQSGQSVITHWSCQVSEWVLIWGWFQTWMQVKTMVNSMEMYQSHNMLICIKVYTMPPGWTLTSHK